MASDLDRPQYNFDHLVRASAPELIAELAETHSKLANLHEEIAYNRASEATGDKSMIGVRIRDEGLRSAYEEKKWLIVRLLELRTNGSATDA